MNESIRMPTTTIPLITPIASPDRQGEDNQGRHAPPDHTKCAAMTPVSDMSYPKDRSNTRAARGNRDCERRDPGIESAVEDLLDGRHVANVPAPRSRR